MKNKFIGTAAAILIIIPILVIANLPEIVVLIGSAKYLSEEKIRPYAKQIEELEGAQKTLVRLQTFIKEQKDRLQESERNIERLKGAHDSLKPIVEAEQEIVKSIFAEQEKRQRVSIWTERVASFFIGIGASLIASLIYSRIRRKSS